MSKQYYPNNFDAIASAPDDAFVPCTYGEFVDWRLTNWSIPSSVICIVRAEHKDTGRIREHVYVKAHAANKRLLKYMQDGNYRVTVADHESISLVALNHDHRSD